MTRDFAANLAEVFWHMTWDLCIDFAMDFFLHMTWELWVDRTDRYFSILLTDDMGISDQIYTWHGTSRKTQTSKMGNDRQIPLNSSKIF